MVRILNHQPQELPSRTSRRIEIAWGLLQQVKICLLHDIVLDVDGETSAKPPCVSSQVTLGCSGKFLPKSAIPFKESDQKSLRNAVRF